MDLRNKRMNDHIVRTFFNCLVNEDFSALTVGQISDAAQINRSTFYRHFEDKYQLRDHIIDSIIQDFVNNLEIRFLDMDITKDCRVYTSILKKSLENIFQHREELEILFRQKLLGRNVLEEMILAGAEKVKKEILNNDSISSSKKELADWYAMLLVNNMLVTTRWWFAHSDRYTPDQVTEMMLQHMTSGTIPTLKS